MDIEFLEEPLESEIDGRKAKVEISQAIALFI